MKRIAIILMILSLLSASQALATTNGYDETVRWWGQIEASGQRIDSELRYLFQKADEQGLSAGQRIELVDRLLKERYPEGSFATAKYGRLVFSPNNIAEFSGQHALILVARIDEVTRRYDLFERRFTIVHRNHSLSGVIRPGNPSASHFAAPYGLPPWVDRTAGTIIGRKETVFSSPFIELLNQVYERRLAETGIRLDQLAEKILTESDAVEQVLALGRELYRDRP